MLTALIALSAFAPAPWPTGIDQLHRLDLLPALNSAVRSGAVTSYDRTGGNDDGFSGAYSFVRKEGDTLVLADLVGPGCVTRIHTPTPTDDILEFTFDGEAQPRLRIPFRKLFSGEVRPFVRPLVDYAGGGYTSYVPMPYQKSCKIVLRAKSLQFYDINYSTYPKGTVVPSFRPTPSAKDEKDIALAKAVFAGGDLTRFTCPAGSKLTKYAFDKLLPAGKSVTLFETKKPGRIAGLRLSPASAFSDKSRDVLLRITWDGNKRPAVFCPAGDLFGHAWGKPAMGSCLLGTSGQTEYCNLPMPFDRAAKVELVSLGTRPVQVRGEVVLCSTPRRNGEGKFYALWRRENPTTPDKPFTYLETRGQGKIVGLALQAQGRDPGNTGFFEGDDVTLIDGEMAVHGTGSEDSFNGGWYDVPGRWDRQFARAFSGCLGYQKPLGRTGGYRFFVADAYQFGKSVLQTIEHGPEHNNVPGDYCSVTYFYSAEPPTCTIAAPSLAERTVVDPRRIVFSPDWTLPISSFSFADATVSRRSIAATGGNARCFSMRAKGEDFFGPPFVEFVCNLPATGRYRVTMDAVRGPESGTVQLFQDEAPVGAPIDLYEAKSVRANGLKLGEAVWVEGDNRVMFKVVGKNAASTGLGFDVASIVFERL